MLERTPQEQAAPETARVRQTENARHTVTLKSTGFQPQVAGPGLSALMPDTVRNIEMGRAGVTLRTTDLQRLLEASGSLDASTPGSMWNLFTSTDKPNAPETVTIKTNELQQFLEASGALQPNIPKSAWNLAGLADTVTMRSTDLQQLFELSGLTDGKVPARPWDIRKAAAAGLNSEGSTTTDLQRLLQANILYMCSFFLQ